jgi:hypothetical protein
MMIGFGIPISFFTLLFWYFLVQNIWGFRSETISFFRRQVSRYPLYRSAGTRGARLRDCIFSN